MIIGTAGHIDHGKTALVRALTGVDTDRLPEERRRGITIDLGFAPLELDGIGRVGIVDVPGHEAFVRTMLAGATGVDLALLVVAADEGTMPQTREHLAILSLLGVQAGVVALTKRDLVDDEWLALVTEDVRAVLAGSPLERAVIVTTSAYTGHGLEELRRALTDALRGIPARSADDLFRLPIDRAFTVRGTGTVVTGTVWSGELQRDQTVRILPAGVVARVRGIQTHGQSIDVARPGTRTAVALAGVELDMVGRGSVLVTDPSWGPTMVLRGDVALMGDAPPLRSRTRVRFHLGTSDVGARVVALAGSIAPGDRSAARVVLESPVVARAGDRFVLRSSSPVLTIGGGIVTDPMPSTRRPRPWHSASSPSARLARLIDDAGASGVEMSTLAVRVGVPPVVAAQLVREIGALARLLGGRLYRTSSLMQIERELIGAVAAHHRQTPLEPGAPLQAIRSRLPASADAIDAVVRGAVAGGALELDGGLIRTAGWQPKLSLATAATRDALRGALASAGREPPSVSELAAIHGTETHALLRLLERDGVIVQVEVDRFYDAEALNGILTVLRRQMRPGREYLPAELRELIGVSRKFLIPLLEYADRLGVTIRQNGGRVLGGT